MDNFLWLLSEYGWPLGIAIFSFVVLIAFSFSILTSTIVGIFLGLLSYVIKRSVP